MNLTQHVDVQSTMAWHLAEFLTRHDKLPDHEWGWSMDRHQHECRLRRPCACCIARRFDCDVRSMQIMLHGEAAELPEQRVSEENRR